MVLLDQEARATAASCRISSGKRIVKRIHFCQKCIFAVKGGLKLAAKTLLSGGKDEKALWSQEFRMAAVRRTKAERSCVSRSENFPAGWLTRCCQKPDSGPEASWQRLHTGCLPAWLMSCRRLLSCMEPPTGSQKKSQQEKKKKKQFGITPARFSRSVCARVACDWRPAPSYIRGSCRLEFRFAVRFRRAQIVCSAAALASSLFIGVDQRRLFTIWVITHHAHLIELGLFYIF